MGRGQKYPHEPQTKDTATVVSNKATVTQYLQMQQTHP